MESEKKHIQEIGSPKPTIEFITERELVILTKENVRDRSRYIHSVFNPVENVSHYKRSLGSTYFLEESKQEEFLY